MVAAGGGKKKEKTGLLRIAICGRWRGILQDED
jgi:hypothetical protein